MCEQLMLPQCIMGPSFAMLANWLGHTNCPQSATQGPHGLAC